jgi:hypothetical protein
LANGLERPFINEQRKEMAMAVTLRKRRMKHSGTAVGALVCSVLLLHALPAAWPQSVKTQQDAERVLTIEKLTIKDHAVSGEVINRSARLLRDVELFIRYTWLWDDEMKPGKADPGSSTYYNLQKEIAPGGRLPFTFSPSPPLTQMSGGHYQTSVTIAGYAEVIPQSK